MKIAIMGVGAVGEAVNEMLISRGHEPLLYDPPKGLDPGEEALAKVDLAFICVPAPTTADGVVNTAVVEWCLFRLREGATAVIRSTVPPGTTDRLQAQRHTLNLFFVPEFLTEATRFEDAKNPNRVVIGIPAARERDTATQEKAIVVRDLFPYSGYTAWITAAEAEMIKYSANAFYALKVAHFNQMFDLCTALGVNYDMIKSAAGMDPWTGPQHLDVHHGGYRGYGGKCLPKDVTALRALAEAAGAHLTILEAADRYNTTLRLIQEQQGEN